MKRALTKASANQPLSDDDILHTRYTLDGEENRSTSWENFQLDGFGTWLWALAEHQRLSSGTLSADVLNAARITADYLAGLWRLPCYDCWEEFNGKMHLHTLAAIYGGLQAYGDLTGDHRSSVLTEMRDFVVKEGPFEGHWQKFLGNPQVDASLLGLSTPYRLVEPSDPVMRRTAEKIEADLCRGGVKRYVTDTYYGGGQWILLAAWLAWYWWEVGEKEKAHQLRNWVETQANEQGWLPEQVPLSLNDESKYEPWLQKWGSIADPLLWSHAQYLILCKFMEE